jgi:hypothetical protein
MRAEEHARRAVRVGVDPHHGLDEVRPQPAAIATHIAIPPTALAAQNPAFDAHLPA